MDKQKSSGISFIGYKRNKKPIQEMGIKRALGLFWTSTPLFIPIYSLVYESYQNYLI